MKKIVYISGPISGVDKELVKLSFKIAEYRMKERGFSVINPLVLTEESDSYGQCMGKDLRELIDNADVVYFCKGWEESRGCMLEFHAAKIYEKDILFE